ncbi:unnamed protein product [Caenorhabditis bovis]|uniref:uridine/cytidine kinase n=1 Tax=Caenorhabditis bovis TaxID=2654633 RepID=A0A8S1F2A8_9PELO|nr:unnamed protein product [Caenorhabditis bovis]
MKQTVFKLPLIIGVAGGTSCGKSTIVDKIQGHLDSNKNIRNGKVRIAHLEMHSFYKELDEEARELVKQGKYNFDHPDAIDFELCANTLQKMRNGETVKIANYDMETSSIKGYKTIEAVDVVIIEGILLLYDEQVRKCLGAKLFIEANAESRLRRRLEKYVHLYNRPPIAVIQQYTDYVKPAFEEFCRPTKKYADVIIPRGADNHVAIALIAENLQEMFRKMVVSTDADRKEENEESAESSENAPKKTVSRPH